MLCDYTNRPWVVIEPDVESPIVTINFNENKHVRFNWLLVEQGFRYDGMPIIGPLSVTGLALMDPSAQLDGSTACFAKDSPGSYSNVCPSSQCFYYGTWELSMGLTIESIVTDYVGTSTHILRSFPLDEDNVRRTQPRPDAPTTSDVAAVGHIPLQFGVPQDVNFVGMQSAFFYQLTTPYCGFINVQHEKATWDRNVASVALGVATDGNPYPSSTASDILFLEAATKALWICPRPPETTSTVYFSVIRYASTGEPPLSTAEKHYFTVDYYRADANWKKYRIGATTTDSGYSNVTNFPPMANWAIGIAANLFRLSCPDPANPSVSKFIDCRAGSASLGTCIQFQFGVPVDPWTVSLLPVPALISGINPEGFGNIEYNTLQPVASKRLSAFLILEVSSDGSVVSQILGDDWQQLWSQCVLQVGSASPVGSIDGEWFFADVAVAPTVPECVYSEFEALSQLINAGIESMADDPLVAYSERVSVDELTFHDPWQACTSFIAAQLSTVVRTNVTVLGSTTCFDNSATLDPCCNGALSWTQCCAARDLSIDVPALQLDGAATNATCHYPSCVEPLLDEYYSAVLSDSIGGCAGPDLSDRLRAPVRVYRDCREAAFGDDFVLPPCVVDLDCASLIGSTYCNQVTRQCAFNLDYSLSYFFSCLADNLPIEARIKLIALNGFEVTASNTLAQQLQQRYGTSSECVDVSFGSPWVLYDGYLETGSRYSGCPVCTRLATDVSYQPPPWCEVRSGARCGYEWMAVSNSAGCAVQVCNWDQTDDGCDSALLGTEFCGVCESDAVCMQVSADTSQVACESIPSVCFLADGTVRTDLSAADCARTFACTQQCGGGSSCDSEEQCTSTGYCETSDEIYEALEATEWYTVPITGFCAIPMKPFNSPDCTTMIVGTMPSSYGCVLFGNCTGLVNMDGCTPAFHTEQLCTSRADAVWWPRYDRNRCLQQQGCNEQLVGVQALSSLGTRLHSPKDEQQCTLCNGELEPLSTWVSGRWLPGTSRSAQWVQRAMVSRYELSDSIDFNSLYDDIYKSSRAAVAFQLQNNIQCSYQTINSLMSKVVCACTTEESRASCFPGGFITSVGQGEACPLTSNTIVAPPARLSYDMNDVSSQLQDQCVEFSIDRLNARFFYGEAPPPISTGFVPTFVVRGWNSVVNKNDALVGQVVGDGVQIHFDQNGNALIRLRVCLQLSSNIALSDDQPFTIYGLGYWTGQSDPATVIPYKSVDNVTVDGGYVCATVALPRNGAAVSFVPIYYRSDWEHQPSARFSSGQKALLYIVATFYAILCVSIVVQLARLVAVGAWDFNVGTNYIWVLLFFMTIIRAIYIYLVAADVLGQQNSHLLVDFWMMDLPTLLYLIVNSVIAMSFLFLSLAADNEKYQNQRYFWITLAVLISFIVAIFVAILLAFNYAVVDTQGAHGPALCSTFTDNSDKATAIRIVYECLLFTIALLIAIIGGVIAARLWWGLRDQVGTTSLLALGCVSSFGILSDSLAFLIYYIVNSPTPYFAIVLIFTEILPITFLVVRVSTKQIKNKKRSAEASPGSRRGQSSSNSFSG